MKRLIAISLVFLCATPALAEDAPATCPAGPDVLGVSRVAEVDTTGGPTFGAQYPPRPLLQPGEVVLTFDDGPFPVHTESILATLAAQCTKATFFQVGSMTSHYPDIAKKVFAQGHTVGTHTWSHANLGGRSAASARAQVERAFTAANGALGDGTVAPFFRFPYLADSRSVREYLATRNVAIFDIDVDSFDYLARSPDRVLRNVMNGLSKTGGGIILFHDIHAVTAKALPDVLAALKEKNFKVVHLVAKTPIQPVAEIETSSVTRANAGAEAKPAAEAKPSAPRRAQRRNVVEDKPWSPF